MCQFGLFFSFYHFCCYNNSRFVPGVNFLAVNPGVFLAFKKLHGPYAFTFMVGFYFVIKLTVDVIPQYQLTYMVKFLLIPFILPEEFQQFLCILFVNGNRSPAVRRFFYYDCITFQKLSYCLIFSNSENQR